MTSTVTFNFANRPSTVTEQTLILTIKATNSYGAEIETTVTLTSQICDIARDDPGDFVCAFVMNKQSGSCTFPENTNIPAACNNPLDFEIKFTTNYESVGDGAFSWASTSGTSDSHKLEFDFKGTGLTRLDFEGLYDARRIQASTTETFKVALCYVT